MSKNALNYFTAQLRNGLASQGFMVLALHPGWIQTDMGGSQAPGNPMDTARGIMDLLEGKMEAQEAWMIDHKGDPMPF
ncbi:hypothetical protein DFP94_103424 [Fontibacillus phaseoli]|uniref:Short subunit dehydrogenase n=1 Tax=Fontibacillus phaseoli TaxID=1416533 RepID=A0A369BH07_9BACL|nr:hypothetical protein [Fontibacillus phaseoli]RCX20691.1 hypothetical protein DFP94_103424 [Fontibacillus phaseoli]